MLLAGRTYSPSIPNGELYWHEGDIFTLNFAVELFDQDDTGIEFTDSTVFTMYFYNERRVMVKSFECEPDEHGNISISIDSTTTALFPWGEYKAKFVYEDSDRRSTIGVFRVTVADMDFKPKVPYTMNGKISGWVSRGIDTAEVDGNGHLILTMTDGDTVDLGKVKGDKGDTGDTGATGATGATGPQGEKGDPFRYSDFTPEQLAALKGPKGDTGATGATGAQGVSGVYIGSDPIPDGYNVQIDPQGDADTLVEEAPNDGKSYLRKNKAWVEGTGGGGTPGEDGGYYTPSVSTAGELTWTASKTGMPTVPGANIKGPKGDTGETGATGAAGPAGSDGADGADGYSPAVTISQITGGHTVKITDKTHPSGQSFNVMDGQDAQGTFFFTVTKDNDENIFLPSGVTLESLYDIFASGRNVVCRLGNIAYTFAGGYNSATATQMVFERRYKQRNFHDGFIEYIVLETGASVGNGYRTFAYTRNVDPFYFYVTLDSDNNVFLGDNVTVQDVYNAYNSGREPRCWLGSRFYSLVGGYGDSAGRIYLEFWNIGLGIKDDAPVANYIGLDSNATVGDGFYTYKYLVDVSWYHPVYKTSDMTKQVGVDSNGHLWTTP